MGNSENDSSGRRRWADLGPRFLSALVLVPVTALVLYLGGVWFAALVGGVFAGAYREWEIMVTSRRPDSVGMVLIGLLALSALLFPLFGIFASILVLAVAVALALVAPSPARCWRAGGVAYLGIVIFTILSIRGTGHIGISAGVFLAASVWLTDSAAFFTGRHLGGVKLSPDISPSKTWSGALGGLAIGTLGGTLVWLVVTPSPWWIGTGFAALLSISGQLGDLAESAIKRRFRVKDSSDLIPGHGGLLDRLDSLTLATVVVFVIGGLHAGRDAVASGFLFW